MLIDFPPSTPETKISLYADDVLLYSIVKHPADAEVTLQPALDRVRRWGRKWKFAPDKSAMVVFTRAYKPGNDPLLFLDGHRIPSQPTFKFLGLWFDSKLLWKPHIDHIQSRPNNSNTRPPIQEPHQKPDGLRGYSLRQRQQNEPGKSGRSGARFTKEHNGRESIYPSRNTVFGNRDRITQLENQTSHP
ncbi:hypothetical protein DAPPUDRAFT_270569 [Daphnia pulex]|uniref:Reverse transcriptase domain-containing protein n=1 Tax=Daphnia pulex TaxID=6669 RepID=E9I0Y2_DAPPU|nr:hypothetical protein DAPPUDRAFT_270569 [Daphnia pulex]|eukprot:EFX62349.1 hypothetical protein DAPPUDRAFT_270569 [Daphnia pulex]